MDRKHEESGLSRRSFLRVGGVAAAASTLPILTSASENEEELSAEARIVRHRTLGRTGFKASDISIGGAASDATVVRYAYDHGINYFDTAESYSNGDAERRIGDAMQFMDRDKIFITTKLEMKDDDTEETILERFGKCQERLKTEWVDALYMHAVNHVATLETAPFHAAVKKLKADGRLKHAGVSCHGPRNDDQDSMEKVLVTAAEDGRFDLMLVAYNFLNKEEGDKILAACKKNNVGTTAMKASPGTLEVVPFDPDNPTEQYAGYLKSMEERGTSREDAVARIQRYVKGEEESSLKIKPFAEKHGIKTEEQLKATSIQWVLKNPDMHTVCVGMKDFDAIDTYVGLSGTGLTQAAADFLRDYEVAFGDQYCRHSCVACVAACPQRLPVSTIMRYSYYFHAQGREKYAIERYAALDGPDASACLLCDAPCTGACPHRVNVQAHLLTAHSLLTVA